MNTLRSFLSCRFTALCILTLKVVPLSAFVSKYVPRQREFRISLSVERAEKE